jgi:hypothetical protein
MLLLRQTLQTKLHVTALKVSGLILTTLRAEDMLKKVFMRSYNVINKIVLM